MLSCNRLRGASECGMECAVSCLMTLSVPERLARQSVRHVIDDTLWTFTHQTHQYRHVWIWDTVNGCLHYTQIRRGKVTVRVRQWHSAIRQPTIAEAFLSLCDRHGPQWYGRDAIWQIHQAFTR